MVEIKNPTTYQPSKEYIELKFYKHAINVIFNTGNTEFIEGIDGYSKLFVLK